MKVQGLVLAAGKGTRMRSQLPKVLHPLCGKPMVLWAVDAAREAGCEVTVVVGHEAERVEAALGGTRTALQADQRGTGHAVLCAAPALRREGVLVVLSGDTPLVRADTLRALIQGHGDALCTVLTLPLGADEVPASAYGRLVRDAAGHALRVVEAANASEEELHVREANSGIYAFDARWLLDEVLPYLEPHPPKGEIYLTDVVEAAARAGRLRAVLHPDASELQGVNDRAQLSDAERALRRRINTAWMLQGVSMEDPATTIIEHGVCLGQDVTLGPGVVLRGNTRLEDGVSVGPYAVLSDTLVCAGAEIRAHTVSERAEIGPESKVGPFSRLREGTHLEAKVHIGNFVETKKVRLRSGAKANHLSYLGDAEIGAAANIGAGTITCNYDGFAKHRTVIGDRAFIGSNAALVAPVRVGNDAIVGAGSVITRDVADNDLALTRVSQTAVSGAAPDIRARNAARAAELKKRGST